MEKMKHREKVLRAIKTTLYAGFIGGIVTLLATCDLLNVGLGAEVDINPPELEISTPSITEVEHKKADFQVGGVVIDDRSAVTVEISWGENTLQATVEETAWTATIPIDQITDDGTLTITAIATDASGKSSAPAYVIVEIDRVPPSVLVTAPQSYSPLPANSDYIIIQGESWDTAPIESVYVEIVATSNTSTVIVRQLAEGDRTWFARILLDDNFTNNADYYYRVLATDVAGNVNTYHYHAWDIWDEMDTGTLFPSMVDIGQWDQLNEELPGLSSSSLETLIDRRAPTSGAGMVLGFTNDSDKDKPDISLVNLDAGLSLLENSIGDGVPILASATDDKEGLNNGVSSEICGLNQRRNLVRQKKNLTRNRQ